MVVFGNGTHVDLCLGSGCGMTSDLRERDLELETIRAFKLACARIRSCIDEGYSRGFPWCYRWKRFRGSGTESGGFGRGADDGSVSTEGELLDSCCDGCRKKMLPNTQSIKGL